MRLIDADILLARVRQIDFLKEPNSTKLSACEIMKIINTQPTAYDVEKVATELEDMMPFCPTNNLDERTEQVLLDAIDIVRRVV